MAALITVKRNQEKKTYFYALNLIKQTNLQRKFHTIPQQPIHHAFRSEKDSPSKTKIKSPPNTIPFLASACPLMIPSVEIHSHPHKNQTWSTEMWENRDDHSRRILGKKHNKWTLNGLSADVINRVTSLSHVMQGKISPSFVRFLIRQPLFGWLVLLRSEFRIDPCILFSWFISIFLGRKDLVGDFSIGSFGMGRFWRWMMCSLCRLCVSILQLFPN